MRLLAVLVMLAGPVAAQDWEPVTKDQVIFDALADSTVVYDAYTLQHFRADGYTQYVTERASDGRWAARDGQYCSQWPPSDGWECYDIQLRADQIKFVSADRSESVGTFQK